MGFEYLMYQVAWKLTLAYKARDIGFKNFLKSNFLIKNFTVKTRFVFKFIC